MSFSRKQCRASRFGRRSFDGRTGRRDRYRPPRRVRAARHRVSHAPARRARSRRPISSPCPPMPPRSWASTRRVARDPRSPTFFAGNPTRDWPAEQLPYATVYSGHQFGVWAGQLGDGRAIVLGEVEHDGERVRAAAQGRRAARRTRAWATAAPCCARRSASSCVRRRCITSASRPRARCASSARTSRCGARRSRPRPSSRAWRRASCASATSSTSTRTTSVDELRALADYVIERFYPQCREADDPYLALLAEVTRRTADLMAQWQAVGFCHGVMNTDNMSILGLTIDYGPFGFMDGFDAQPHLQPHRPRRAATRTAASRRSATGTCFCLAQALLPLLRRAVSEEGRSERAIEDAQRVLEGFKTRLRRRSKRACARSSVSPRRATATTSWSTRLLEVMHANRADFTLTFRNLREDVEGRCVERCARARPVPRPRRLRRVGERLPRAAGAGNAQRRRARRRDESREPEIRAAQSPGGAGDPPARRRRTSPKSSGCCGCCARPFDEQPEHEVVCGLAARLGERAGSELLFLKRHIRCSRLRQPETGTDMNRDDAPAKHEAPLQKDDDTIAQELSDMRISGHPPRRHRARRSPANTGITASAASTTASVAARRCSNRTPSSTPAAAGRATSSRSTAK